MSNYASLKATINANIRENNNQEITGVVLNSVLNGMVDALGTGYLFKGIASTSTNPGSPDEKVFYIAGETGTFSYFGSLTANENELTIFYFDSSWHKVAATITTEHPVEVGDEQNSDLDITDTMGNILVRFANGHIKVKNFDSSDIPHPVDIGNTSSSDVDFEIADDQGNVLVRFKNGYIQTANFNAESFYRNTILQNKRFSFIGDSITSFSGKAGVTNPYYPHGDITMIGQMWYSRLASLCQASINRVSATGGSCITDGYGTAPSFQGRLAELNSAGETGMSPEFIFILGGVNDWNTGAALGDYTETYTDDETLPTTFIPSYRRLLYKMQTTYPNAEIVALTPIRSYYGSLSSSYPPIKGGRNLNDYVDAIKKCCELHGVVCVDLYNMINLSLANISTYTNDKLHPKADLMEKVAKIIYQQILNLF